MIPPTDQYRVFLLGNMHYTVAVLTARVSLFSCFITVF